MKYTHGWPLRVVAFGTIAYMSLVGCEGTANLSAAVVRSQQQGVSATPTPDGTSSVAQDDNDIVHATPIPSLPPSVSPTALFNCDNANFPVCDGFETVASGALPDPNRWNSAVGAAPDDGTISDHPAQNTVAVTSVRAHRGSQSLHIHTVGGTEHLVIQDVTSVNYPHAFLPATNNTFYVRLWMYDDGFGGDLTQVPPGSSHLYMINASGPLAGRQQYQKFGAGDGPDGPATLNWNYYGNDAIVTDANFKWPIGVWTCFETGFDGATGELTVWQDETLVPRLHVAAGTWAAPAFNRLTIGWEMDHPPTNFLGTDVYIDDVAYSYKRIGCTP